MRHRLRSASGSRHRAWRNLTGRGVWCWCSQHQAASAGEELVRSTVQPGSCRCHHRGAPALLPHPRRGAAHAHAAAGSRQREHAAAASQGPAVEQAHPPEQGCKYLRAATGLLGTAATGMLAFARLLGLCWHRRPWCMLLRSQTRATAKPQHRAIFGSAPKNFERVSDVRVLDGGKLEQMARGFRAAALLRTDIYRQI